MLRRKVYSRYSTLHSMCSCPQLRSICFRQRAVLRPDGGACIAFRFAFSSLAKVLRGGRGDQTRDEAVGREEEGHSDHARQGG